MDRTKFAQKIFSNQDKRDELENDNHGDLLISQVILESEDSSEFINTMYYWMDEIEKAIFIVEDIQEDKGGDFKLKD